MSFDEDPLDLLEDDGDGIIETAIFFDEEEKGQQSGRGSPPQGSGCGIVLLLMGSTILFVGYGVYKVLA